MNIASSNIYGGLVCAASTWLHWATYLQTVPPALPARLLQLWPRFAALENT